MKRKLSATYDITLRTWRTFYFPVISLLTLQTIIISFRYLIAAICSLTQINLNN